MKDWNYSKIIVAMFSKMGPLKGLMEFPMKMAEFPNLGDLVIEVTATEAEDCQRIGFYDGKDPDGNEYVISLDGVRQKWFSSLFRVLLTAEEVDSYGWVKPGGKD